MKAMWQMVKQIEGGCVKGKAKVGIGLGVFRVRMKVANERMNHECSLN